jgi:5-methylcytosine-specific restriction endonuclease McrA
VGAIWLDGDSLMTSGPGKGTKATLKLIARLRARDGDNCMYCHEPIDFSRVFGFMLGASIDHIRPKAAGGSNHLSNLQLMHTDPCQKKKGAWWNGVNYDYDDPRHPPGKHDTMSGVYRLGDRPS